MASDLHLFYPYFFILKKNSNYGSEGGLFSDGLRPAARGLSDNGGRFRCPPAPAAQVSPPHLPLFTNDDTRTRTRTSRQSDGVYRTHNKNKKKQAK